jgi:hypothetical protein
MAQAFKTFVTYVLCLPIAIDSRFGSRCPKVQTAPNLDLDEFTRASWYVQEQQINSYQSEDQLHCVVATYDAGVSSFWEEPLFHQGAVLSVYNFYEGGRPTVESGSPANRLCASVTRRVGKLLVAPCFLPSWFGGKYWVIGFNTTSDGQYEWAVISGGRPTRPYSDGCTTGTGYFDSGLWIFSRRPALSAEKLAEAKNFLVQKGYTLQLLKRVRQTNCSYSGAYIKA